MDCSEDGNKSKADLRFDETPKTDIGRIPSDRFLQTVRRDFASSLKSSPLKRSDGVMNLEAASLGSPRSYKRRSLHSPFGTDINIFEHAFDGAMDSSIVIRTLVVEWLARNVRLTLLYPVSP